MSPAQPLPTPGTPSTLSPEEQRLVAELVADGLSIQDKFSPEPLHKETGKRHFENDAIDEMQHLKEQQPNGVNHERE